MIDVGSLDDGIPALNVQTPRSNVFHFLKRYRGKAATPSTEIAAKETHSLDTQEPNVAEGASGDAEQEYIEGLRLFAVLGSVVLAAFLMMLDTSIVATATPHITTQFHSLADVGWYGSAFMLASCSLQPLTGKIYSRFGTKTIFLSFFALFELGSLICAVARSSDMFIIGRAVAGMGSSGLMNGAMNIISASVPLIKRPLYLGVMISVAQLGILLGPVIGGVLTQYASWRWCFYINLPAGGAVFSLLGFIHVPNLVSKSAAKLGFKGTLASFDLLGFALFAPFAIQLLLALEWGGTAYPWDSATIIGLFCGSAGTLCLFIIWENHRGESAMIPPPLIKQKVIWSSCLTMFFVVGGMMTYSYYVPLYFQAVRDATPTMSGVYLLPGIISQMIFAIVSGALVGRLGYYLPWAVFGTTLVSISMGLISTFTPKTSTGKWIGYQIIGGVGRGSVMQMPIIAVQSLVAKEQIPVSSALIFFSQNFGGALFLSFADTIFSTGLKDALVEYAPGVTYSTVAIAGATGFRSVISKPLIPDVIVAYNLAISHVFYLAAGACSVSFLVCWGMGWRSLKKPKTVEPEA